MAQAPESEVAAVEATVVVPGPITVAVEGGVTVTPSEPPDVET